jgi:hypothetical protein
MMRKPSAILTALVLIPLGACGLFHATIRSPHFTESPDPTVGTPPLDNLFLWLEFGEETMSLSPSGFVTTWRDARSPDRMAVGTLPFLGSPVTASLRSPSFGTIDTFTGLRCTSAPGQCSYTIRDPALQTPPSLDGLRYTIFAVVRPANERGDNYVVMTGGTGCNPRFGGTGCGRDSALHIGWSGPRTVRHGHYDDDAFAETRSVTAGVALITGRFQSGALDIGLLDSVNNVFLTKAPALSLANSGAIFVGGTPFTGATGPSVPDWHFEGDIFAVLIYTGTMNDANRRRAESYLRNRYGPR